MNIKSFFYIFSISLVMFSGSIYGYVRLTADPSSKIYQYFKVGSTNSYNKSSLYECFISLPEGADINTIKQVRFMSPSFMPLAVHVNQYDENPTSLVKFGKGYSSNTIYGFSVSNIPYGSYIMDMPAAISANYLNILTYSIVHVQCNPQNA